MKLADIARAIDGRLIGDGDIEIARPVPPGEAESAADLTLGFPRQALDRTLDSPAVAALVAAGTEVPEGVLKGIIEVADPRAALVPLSALFARLADGNAGIHPTAVVVDRGLLRGGHATQRRGTPALRLSPLPRDASHPLWAQALLDQLQRALHRDLDRRRR